MNLSELLELISRYDMWVYALLLTYCLGKTGPLPMLAGYAAAQGALQVGVLLMVTVMGSMAGGQLRFALGRFASPWFCRTFTSVAPWIALASAGVERYSLRVLLAYRFVKGAFSLVGLGAGSSLITWRKYAMVDGAGAIIWIGGMVSIGWSLGMLDAAFDPKWAAYFGLTLLLLSVLTLAALGKRLKMRLLPLAEKIMKERDLPGFFGPIST